MSALGGAASASHNPEASTVIYRLPLLRAISGSVRARARALRLWSYVPSHQKFPPTRFSQDIQALSPKCAAIFPTRELAPFPSKNFLLEAMYMPRLHRVSITFVRRRFERNPRSFERTTEIIM